MSRNLGAAHIFQSTNEDVMGQIQEIGRRAGAVCHGIHGGSARDINAGGSLELGGGRRSRDSASRNEIKMFVIEQPPGFDVAY
ncbi:hypothetical protein IFM46972_11084 [Aspergillus udagawae]|uniref:Uncharacterized protein n=1 Tax=Aspergillus udagawae TaxID=91492 RepID=A0A8H3SEV9_9EURO|nr:hypothetical protein IFM46972_11084 [Aspergillus udagawae]